MKILFMGNNRLGVQALSLLCEQHSPPLGVVLHPLEKRKYSEQFLEIINKYQLPIFDGARLREPEIYEEILSLRADLAFSIMFGYILKPDLIESFPSGVLNLHPSYLPFNRGQYPNVWSIVDGTPAGVTLHYIDAGIDTGDIIAQREVPVSIVDTGESLYQKLEAAALSLFKEMLPDILTKRVHSGPQPKDIGTFHYTKDVEKIDCIDLNHSYRAGDLINILRARTFAPYTGAYFEFEGKRVYLRLDLQEEAE